MNESGRLLLELLELEKEKTALYVREKDLKARLKTWNESILVQSRNGKVIDEMEE